MDKVGASVSRYHEKIAAGFLENWIKENIDLPSKEKAKKYLKKTIKSQKDLDDLYAAMSSITSFLKSKTSSESVYPPGFVKNLAVLIAMVSIVGNISSQESFKDKLLEEKIVIVKDSPEVKKQDKYMGEVTLTKEMLKKINPNKSIEDMNKVILKSMKDDELISFVGPRKLDIAKIKHPLELKITTDKAGMNHVYPSQIKNYKGDTTFYVHQERSSEDVERIEKDLKQLQKERKDKHEKI